jgi:hypothetical protein
MDFIDILYTNKHQKDFTDVYVHIALLEMELYCFYRNFIYIYILYLSLAESFVIGRLNFRNQICKKVIFITYSSVSLLRTVEYFHIRFC